MTAMETKGWLQEAALRRREAQRDAHERAVRPLGHQRAAVGRARVAPAEEVEVGKGALVQVAGDVEARGLALGAVDEGAADLWFGELLHELDGRVS